MNGFLPWAALLLLGAALSLCLPLLRRREGGAPAAPWLAAALGLVIAALAAGVYPLLSNYSWKAAAEREQLAANAGIPALRAEAEAHPSEARAWARLGGAWTTLQQWSEARAAFERAVAVSGRQEPAALSGLAQVLVLGGEGQVSPAALGLFEEALRLDPASAQALFYSGLAYLQAGDIEEARKRFVTLLALGPPQGVRDALQRQVAQLDQQLAAQAAAATAGISLQVSLAPALAGQVPAGASLFVFVPSPTGGPPLAVKRLGSQLPQELSLSPADSMLPDHSFKTGDIVRVVARLSKSGSPQGAPGDLYGEIKAKAGKGGSHSLVIDRQVPAN